MKDKNPKRKYCLNLAFGLGFYLTTIDTLNQLSTKQTSEMQLQSAAWFFQKETGKSRKFVLSVSSESSSLITSVRSDSAMWQRRFKRQWRHRVHWHLSR